MANKVLSAISLVFCFIALVLTCYAFHAENWANFDTGSDEYEYGLFTVTDGPDEEVGKSWDCNRVIWCEISDEYDGLKAYENAADASCDQAKAFWNGALMYFVCNLVAFIFLCKYMIGQMSIMKDRDPGHKLTSLSQAILFTVLSLVGFAGWWGFSKASYSANCDDDDFGEDLLDGDRWEMCAGPGATISIVAIAIMLIAGILAIANTLLQNDLRTISLSGAEVCGVRTKVHFSMIVGFLYACVALGITGIVIRKWVNFEASNGDDYEGSLFSIDSIKSTTSEGVFDLDNYGWDCMAVSTCDDDSDKTNCQTFEPLMDAGRLYLRLEIAVIGCLVIWDTFFIYSNLYNREQGHPILNHALPHLAWILQLVAVITWSVLSEVKFERGDCENDDLDPDEQADVCITTGPILMIVQLFLQIMLAVYFSTIYYKRGSPEAGDEAMVAPEKDTQGQIEVTKGIN